MNGSGRKVTAKGEAAVTALREAGKLPTTDRARPSNLEMLGCSRMRHRHDEP
jgi:hypothetical protein